MPSNEKEFPSDPFHLSRFIAAQEDSYPAALAELRQGRKQSHWMWFIFPQIAGLGSSFNAQRYAIRSKEEASAYLAHPLLGRRLVEISEALLEVDGRSATEILGSPDDLKLKSSMTLFAEASSPGSVFSRVLAKFFGAEADHRTLSILQYAR